MKRLFETKDYICSEQTLDFVNRLCSEKAHHEIIQDVFNVIQFHKEKFLLTEKKSGACDTDFRMLALTVISTLQANLFEHLYRDDFVFLAKKDKEEGREPESKSIEDISYAILEDFVNALHLHTQMQLTVIHEIKSKTTNLEEMAKEPNSIVISRSKLN